MGNLFGVACSIWAIFEKVGAILLLLSFGFSSSDSDEESVSVDAVMARGSVLGIGCGELVTDEFGEGGSCGGGLASGQRRRLHVTGGRLLMKPLLRGGVLYNWK